MNYEALPSGCVPNASSVIRELLRDFGAENREILSITCGRFCSVAREVAIPGSDVDKLVVLVEGASRELDILDGLDLALHKVGSRLNTEERVVSIDDALRDAEALCKDYASQFQPFYPFDEELIALHRRQNLLLKEARKVVDIARAKRDLVIYQKDELPKVQVSQLIESYLNLEEASGRALNEEKGKTRLRKRVFDLWNELSYFERKFIVEGKMNCCQIIVSSKERVYAQALEHFAQEGVARELSAQEVGQRTSLLYLCTWLYGDWRVNWGADDLGFDMRKRDFDISSWANKQR